MPDYAYKGLDSSTGKEVKGNINADNEEEALQKIKAKGITPMGVELATGMNKEVKFNFGGGKQPTPHELAVFCRQMVSVLQAGVSLIKSLEMIGTQTSNPALRQAIEGCKTKIEQGSSMHEAMQDYKCMQGIFSTMIASGEESGSLETAFSRMADQFDKTAATKALVKKSLMYPCVLACVMVGVVIVMLVFVIPKFQDFLGSLGGELPAFTLFLVNASNFVRKNFIVIAGVIAVLVFLIKKAVKTPAGRSLFDKIKLKAPLLGTLTEKQACSNLMRTLSTLLATGIGMIEALDIVKNTMTNIYYVDALNQVKMDVSQGDSLSSAIERTKMFPPMVYQMTRIGEETGNLVDMFDKTAEYFDEEVKTATESVTSLIEPLVIVCMAGVVGGMVIALLMPMMSMYDNLDSM